MKTLLSLVGALALSMSISAQGISFFEGSWDDAVAKAKKENKHLFVDCYAVWCGPCKWMDANVFPNETVGQVMNERFVCVKLDMEKEGDGMDMAKRMEVRSYPTYLFFDASDKPVHRAVGSMPEEKFLDVAMAALDPNRQYYALKEQYESMKGEPEWVLNYAIATDKAGLSAKEYINQYASMTQPNEWEMPHNLERLVQVSLPFESAIYSHMIQRQEALRPMVPDAEQFDFVLSYPKNMYIRKAAYEAEKEGDLQPYFETIAKVLPADEVPPVVAKLHMNWYKRHEPANAWEKTCLYMDQYCEEWYEFNAEAWALVENEGATAEQLKKGLEWIDRSIAMERGYANVDTKAWLLYKMGKTSEAEAAANEAIQLAKESEQDYEGTTELLEMIHGS